MHAPHAAPSSPPALRLPTQTRTISSPQTKTTPSQIAALRRDCAAALQVVVDAGQGRWVKLLGARSSAHMRLRLYELKQLLDASEEVRVCACRLCWARGFLCDVMVGGLRDFNNKPATEADQPPTDHHHHHPLPQIAAYAEACGARTLGSFRSSLQAQCKAFLDSQHSRCTMQLQHLLEVRMQRVLCADGLIFLGFS